MKVEVIVYFASWCGPCYAHRKNLEDFDYVVEVDIADAPDEATNVPLTVLKVDNRVIKKHEGAMTTAQFKDWIGKYDPEINL